MSTFLTRRDAKQQQEEKRLQAAEQKAEKRRLKLRHKDLMWAAKNRFLNDSEWYELHKLDNEYGKWGPEQAEYEFSKLGELRSYWQRHSVVKTNDPHLDALQRHLALHAEQTEIQEKASSKKLVYSHPEERLSKKK